MVGAPGGRSVALLAPSTNGSSVKELQQVKRRKADEVVADDVQVLDAVP